MQDLIVPGKQKSLINPISIYFARDLQLGLHVDVDSDDSEFEQLVGENRLQRTC